MRNIIALSIIVVLLAIIAFLLFVPVVPFEVRWSLHRSQPVLAEPLRLCVPHQTVPFASKLAST